MTDIAIRNVAVLDGSGSPAFAADVEIENGRIVSVNRDGTAGPADIEIDARGLTLAPGFIDTHAHDDGAFFRHPGMEFKLAQGVTTVVSGNCGFSAVPADPERDPATASGGILAGLEGRFTDLDGYFAAVLEREPAINNMMLVGHNTVRSLVMNMEQRAPSTLELKRMKEYVALALDQGACGFSTGLIYRPGRWSETEEVIELATAARTHDALYTTHMRNEGGGLLESVAEVIRIASCPAFRAYEGRMLKDIAEAEGIDITDAVRRILTAPKGDRTICIQFIIDEADVETNLAHADMMVGSDGIPDLRGKPHPRLFGTFPRVLGHYVRERGILSLPEAVRRMTALSAETFGIRERGQVREGYRADLTLFDPATIIDRASYDEPKTEPDGIRLVIVNGAIAFDRLEPQQPGRHTGVGTGRMLRYRRTDFGENE